MADLDLSAIEASIAAMSPEEIRKQLTEIKTRQKVAQKKYYNPEVGKAQRARAKAKTDALVAAAKAAGIYDQVMVEAGKLADEKLAEQEVEEEVEV